MTKKMLIDATHKEETRVAVTEGNKLDEYDYESQSRKPLKGSIFLAKVTRVEPSLQAAFVNFGGNRHGFLPFSEIHPDYFRIPVADREALMAEQEELLKQHDEEEEEFEEEAQETDASESEDTPVPEPEEVGGEVAALDDDDEHSDDANGNVALPQEDDSEAEDEDEKSSDDEGDDAQLSEDGNEENSSDDSEGADEKGENQGNNRGRGRGRGRNNNNRGRGGRSQYRNPNVEVIGGEELDGEQRFRFNLRRKYKIQEVIKRGQIMLVQVNKEERGNKGAAVGSYLSLPGRYCVLMPNSPRAGGVSRKIANHKDRARMREIVKDLEVPKGMSVIVRTAGVTRTKVEIKRDLDYLMRLWDNIRDLTLQSTAPANVYEEADLIKRAVRDHYTRDVEEIIVSGKEGFETAKSFMKMMVPSHVKKVKLYEDTQLPLFHRYQIETQIDEIGMTEVRLKSGGYLVINPTEALVSIDVNSGKSTKGRHIEETALKTNLEAADEVARQLRLRDLGGLVVIDFIDMEDRRNNSKVERRMKDALSGDRARIQVGRISSFGLMELSRQRLSPSLTEAQYEKCKTCSGLGLIRTEDAMSIFVLRAIEEEGIRGRAAQIIVRVTGDVALYILNHKRKKLAEIEGRYGFEVLIRVDDEIPSSDYNVEVSKPKEAEDVVAVEVVEKVEQVKQAKEEESEDASTPTSEDDDGEQSSNRRRRGRRGGRRRGNRDQDSERENNNQNEQQDAQPSENAPRAEESKPEQVAKSDDGEAAGKPKRRRSPRKKVEAAEADTVQAEEKAAASSEPANDSAGDKVPSAKEEKQKKKAAPRKRASSKKEAEVKSDDVAASASVEAPVAKPASAKKKAVAEKKEKQAEPVTKDYEVVNEPPKQKKKGWWSLG